MVVFCVCVLNLFIAVHGEAYDSAQEKAFTSFLQAECCSDKIAALTSRAHAQERAGICLHCLLRPSWPPRCLKWRVPHRIRTYVFLQLASIAAWLLLLREETINVLIPTALLWGSAMLGDAILVQRPWIKSKEDCSCGISRHISEQNQVLNQKVQGMDSRLQGLESLIEDLHTKSAKRFLERGVHGLSHCWACREQDKESLPSGALFKDLSLISRSTWHLTPASNVRLRPGSQEHCCHEPALH
eukprot:g24202.t1